MLSVPAKEAFLAYCKWVCGWRLLALGSSSGKGGGRM